MLPNQCKNCKEKNYSKKYCCSKETPESGTLVTPAFMQLNPEN